MANSGIITTGSTPRLLLGKKYPKKKSKPSKNKKSKHPLDGNPKGGY